jgi:transposase
MQAAGVLWGQPPHPTEELSMTGTTILAIDLGKYKCVACAYDRATAAAEFRTVTTSRATVERLIRDCHPAVVVIEACTLAGWVRDLCAEIGVACKAANTAAEAWRYKHPKRKTDRDDALPLAQLEALGQIPEVVVPAKPVREWRALIAHRQAEELVAAAETKLDEIGKADVRVRLLDTVPGLGPRTAEAVVAHLDDPKRFKSGKQVAAYGGLVPRQFQSGEDDRRGRITKRGPAVLRKLLEPVMHD